MNLRWTSLVGRLKSYLRPMKQPICRAIQLLLLCAIPAVAAERGRERTLVFISGEFEYKSAETLPAFKKDLETNHPFNCIYLQRERGESIPGLEALERADLVILFVRRMTLPDEQLAKIRKYVQSGKPLIGLRTASHAFENWKEFDRQVLGGNYQGHHGNQLIANARIISEAAGHPILKGVEKEFVTDGSLYRNAPLPASSKPLLSGSVTDKPPEPIAWTHSYRGARVFYTSLGHPKDFENPCFRRMLINAIYWALNQPGP
jgi:type 1 glutamine amidotransferase